MNTLPNWNARKIREAAIPLKGKPLRDTGAYVRSLIMKDRIPSTAIGEAIRRAAATQ